MSCNNDEWSKKDPVDVVGYKFNWSDVLASGEVITSADFSIAPSGSLIEDESTYDDTTATIVVSAGTAGAIYSISCTITTDADQTFKRSNQLWVLNQ